MREAIGASMSALAAAGIDRRFLCTCVWHAMVTSVLEAASPDLAVAVLEDRAAATKGYGINGDSPIRILSEADQARRRDEVPRGAEIVYAHAMPVVDIIDDRERDGLQAFIQVSSAILKDWWGPVHLRRILGEQAKAFRRQLFAPIAPSEPIWPNKKKAPAAREAPANPRSVHLFVVVGNSSPRWAVTAEATSSKDGLKDMRTITGMAHDALAARRAAISACLDVVEGIGAPHPEDMIDILSDLPDPSSDPTLPADLSERFATTMRDRKARWGRGAPEHAKLIEKAKRAIDEKAA